MPSFKPLIIYCFCISPEKKRSKININYRRIKQKYFKKTSTHTQKKQGTLIWGQFSAKHAINLININ
jgi:hypothetical protein